MQVTNDELKIINRVAKNLSPIFAFSYYDKEDIAQEVRLLCLQIIEDFDSSKGGLYTYLFIYCRNYLLDIRRSKYKKTIHPCTICEFYEGKCTKHNNTEECAKYWRDLKINMKKRDLATVHPIFDKVYYEVDFATMFDNKEVCEEIDRAIPANMRHNYIKFLEGISINNYDRVRVIETIQRIAKEKGFIKDQEGENDEE